MNSGIEIRSMVLSSKIFKFCLDKDHNYDYTQPNQNVNHAAIHLLDFLLPYEKFHANMNVILYFCK